MGMRLTTGILFLTAAVMPAFAKTAVPASAPVAVATTAPASRPVVDASDVKASITHHQIMLDGKPLAYTATAGDLIIKDESGKPRADMFFVAYHLDAATDPAVRPITFLFNGGPGAAAVWLHLGGVGPRVIELNDHDLPVGPPYKLVDNSATWLGTSDLVFIDPVSTGYSRPAPGVKADEFHGVQQDVASVADFIRLYLTQYQRWSSPKYIAGESYGTTRAAALAGYLNDHDGIAVNGIVLMSSVLDFQSLITRPGNDEPYVMYLPSYAAVAWYHHKLSPELQADFHKTIDQAKTFAIQQYAPALAQGSALVPDRRVEVIKQLSAFTGLSADLIDRGNLRISPGLFEKELLGDGHHIIGRFDGRITAYDPNALAHAPSFDPSLSLYFPAYSATFNDYVRRVLHYKSDLPYEVLTDRVQPWSFGQEGGGYLYVIDNLQSAILRNPHLRVMFVSGYYDLATPFFSADHAIDRMNLGPDLRKNVTHEYFPTGHMIYHHREAARKLANDVAAFMEQTTRTSQIPVNNPVRDRAN